ncbi:hypothetical protein KJN74_04095, partial [Candidatus Bathyarchaeota archaeon]|nr:hypothetical protein [Candidatus Bathyarchaeota archaeon]
VIKAKLKNYKLQLVSKKKEGKEVISLNKRIKRQREILTRQKKRINQIKGIQIKRIEKLKESLKRRKERDAMAVDKMKIKINVQKETRDYNVSTSLKSYIDPRIYYEWGKQVQFDWKQYYAKSLHKKFSWLDYPENNSVATN